MCLKELVVEMILDVCRCVGELNSPSWVTWLHIASFTSNMIPNKFKSTQTKRIPIPLSLSTLPPPPTPKVRLLSVA